MKVKLIDYTKDAAQIVAAGARICYSKDDIDTLYEGLQNNPARVNDMVHKVFESNHMSCFEHINFTFLIGDISRIMSHQFVRHRLMSPHERSQRYVNVDQAADSGNDADYCVIPETILEDPIAFDMYVTQVKEARKAYNRLIERGIPKEDARYLLPGGSKTALIATFNGRSLIHFLKLRCCRRAMSEHRQVATLMLEEVRKVCPDIFDLVGPSCYMEGHCPEGKMSCGEFLVVQEQFKPNKYKAE